MTNYVKIGCTMAQKLGSWSPTRCYYTPDCNFTKCRSVFAVQHFAGTVYAVILCPSVCPSFYHTSEFYQEACT